MIDRDLRLHSATPDDVARVHVIRHGTSENQLNNPALVTDREIAWYLEQAIFRVSKDADGMQGFTCVNHQTGYVCALFVIGGEQGRERRKLGEMCHPPQTPRHF